MSKIKLTGDSSGYVEISAPSAAGNNTLELPASGSKIVVSDGSDNINVAGIATIVNGLNVTSGNVGVGTENPQRVAHIFGSASSGTNLLVETPSTNNDSAGIKLKPSSGNEYEIQSVVSTAANSANSFIVYDRTNDAYRMIIDSSGRVTMPHQPAFVATAIANQTPTTDTDIAYATVITNIGNNYNSANSRFTAPVNGFYTFSLRTWMSDNTSGTVFVYLNINGSVYSELRYNSPTTLTEYVTILPTWNLYLSVGDYVNISGYGSGTNVYHTSNSIRYSEFSGHLIG